MGTMYEFDLEQMLATIQPIAVEVMDQEYQAYLRTPPRHDEDEDMSYQQWLNCKANWQMYNKMYTEEIDPLGYENLTDADKRRERELMHAMMDIEFILRY